MKSCWDRIGREFLQWCMMWYVSTHPPKTLFIILFHILDLIHWRANEIIRSLNGSHWKCELKMLLIQLNQQKAGDRNFPYNPQRQFSPWRASRGREIISASIKSIRLHHRTCSEGDSTPHKPSSGTWRIFTSGTVNCPSGRFTTWPRAAAKRRWATFLRGWRRASTFTAAPPSGHSRLAASSTEAPAEGD